MNGNRRIRGSPDLNREREELSARLAEAEDLIRAIRCGEVDALFVGDNTAESVVALPNAHAGHRVLVESMHEGAAILNESGLLLYCNQRLADMLDAPLEAVMGKTLSHFVATEQQAGFDELLKRGITTAGAGDFTLRRSDETLLPVKLALSPMQVEDETGICLVVTDMTENKRVETELRALSASLDETVRELRHKNEEVEAFVYIVSHDLRAPLVNLEGFSLELEESCDRLKLLLDSVGLAEEDRKLIFEILNDDVAKSLTFIAASTSKFGHLINALLAYSRLGRQVYNIERVNVAEVVAISVKVMQGTIQETGAEVEIGPLPPVLADATALGQVFSNLIGNALKYRNPARPLKVEVAGKIEKGMAHYWVKDNGLGIPEQAKARIFQIFQRFHPEMAQGEGMGLAIVHRIIERHHGVICAESKEGQGTEFHFCLPVDPAA